MTYINIPLLDAWPCMSTYIKRPEFFDMITLFLSAAAAAAATAASATATAPDVSFSMEFFACLRDSRGKSRLAFSSLGTSPKVDDPLDDSANKGPLF